MKKYRALLPIVMIVLLLASWYMLFSEVAKKQAIYDQYLTTARDFAKDGITKYAIANYNLAMEVKESPDLYKEVADYYMEQEEYSDYLDWCEDFLEAYPKEASAYEYLIKGYALDKDYEECFELINTARKRNIKSEYIEELANGMKYVFKLEFGSYDDVKTFSYGYCPVMSKDLWGFIDESGNLTVSAKYVSTGSFSQYGYAPVVDQSNTAYYLDNTDEKVKVSRDGYIKLGMLENEIATAQREDGKYVYVDKELNKIFGEYDYASTMNYDVAAVKNGSQWNLINRSGDKIGSDTYLDIKLDEKEVAFRNDRAFVSKTEGKYILVNGSGDRVGSLEFEDAELFMGGPYAAVKIDGRWKYINADGELISDKSYEGARSFSNGFAGVRIDGVWGFVDESENIVIEPEFNGTSHFTSRGSCLVKISDKWKLLTLYSFN